MDNTINSKNTYKIFLSILKFLPTILAVTKILGLILSYLGFTSFTLTLFGGTSIALLVILYILSYIFRFCLLHRLSLHYVTTITVITSVIYYLDLSIMNNILLYIFSIISGIFIIAYVVVAYLGRKNPKIDHIKQLCESYANCCK